MNNFMSQRAVFRIFSWTVMLAGIFFFPWWVTLMLALFFMFAFSFYAEALFFAFMMDLTYAAPEVFFHDFRFVSLVATLAVFVLIELLKRRILV